MREIKFFIPGEVGAKQRPRVNYKSKNMYTPQKTLNYESLVAWHYQNLANKVFWDNNPLEIEILSLFAIPKSYTKKRVAECMQGKKSPSQKDVDNIAKIICDGLNGVAYTDDRHIMSLSSIKMYTDESEKVGVYITLKDFELKGICKI